MEYDRQRGGFVNINFGYEWTNIGARLFTSALIFIMLYQGLYDTQSPLNFLKLNNIEHFQKSSRKLSLCPNF